MKSHGKWIKYLYIPMSTIYRCEYISLQNRVSVKTWISKAMKHDVFICFSLLIMYKCTRMYWALRRT